MKTLKYLLIFTIFISAINVYSCTCIGDNSLKEDIKQSDLVFKGQILDRKIVTVYNSDTLYAKAFYKELSTELKKKYKTYENYKSIFFGTKMLEYSVKKEKHYKGRKLKSEIVVIRTGFGKGDCGFNFEIGEVYLIFAYRSQYLKFSKNRLKSHWKNYKSIFETNICTRTKLYSLASKGI